MPCQIKSSVFLIVLESLFGRATNVTYLIRYAGVRLCDCYLLPFFRCAEKSRADDRDSVVLIDLCASSRNVIGGGDFRADGRVGVETRDAADVDSVIIDTREPYTGLIKFFFSFFSVVLIWLCIYF